MFQTQKYNWEAGLNGFSEFFFSYLLTETTVYDINLIWHYGAQCLPLKT